MVMTAAPTYIYNIYRWTAALLTELHKSAYLLPVDSAELTIDSAALSMDSATQRCRSANPFLPPLTTRPTWSINGCANERSYNNVARSTGSANPLLAGNLYIGIWGPLQRNTVNDVSHFYVRISNGIQYSQKTFIVLVFLFDVCYF